MQKNISEPLVVRTRSDQWFPSYERFCEKVIFLCFSVVAHLTEFTPGIICDNSEHFGENQSALELMVSER